MHALNNARESQRHMRSTLPHQPSVYRLRSSMEKQVFCAKLKMFAAGLLQLLVEGNPE